MMKNVNLETMSELAQEIFYVEARINLLTGGVQATPIKKGVLGYKCKQDIVTRDEYILDNLTGIQEHTEKLHELIYTLFAEMDGGEK